MPRVVADYKRGEYIPDTCMIDETSVRPYSLLCAEYSTFIVADHATITTSLNNTLNCQQHYDAFKFQQHYDTFNACPLFDGIPHRLTAWLAILAVCYAITAPGNMRCHNAPWRYAMP